MSVVQLREVDSVEVAVLVDNYSDILLPDAGAAKRLRVQPPDAPLAEHGLSCMIKVRKGEEQHTILMDAGVSGVPLEHNADLLAGSQAVVNGEVTANIQDVESVFLSHGHFDHFGGLAHFLANTQKDLPLTLHPDAFSQRRSKRHGLVFKMPPLDETVLASSGAVLNRSAGPVTLAADMILSTGEVERRTSFEKSPKTLEAKIDGQWITDPFKDDQALAIQVKNKGLVIVGGCSHSGIINTITTIQKNIGSERIHAVLGGFHLSGAENTVIDPTVAEMRRLSPDYVIPMHCTGWDAINRFAREMPDQFILNSVGTTYIFGPSMSK
jgi:7,8-dihydropterin-6-yl-methyl-4-(beta-D-ribofuranosyl)aminobenzene 5'-phosphate synthase